MWKFKKKRNIIKERFISFSHIWRINTPECVYWLDMLLNTNTVHFCDFIFRHRTVLPKKGFENQKSYQFRMILNKILYFSKYEGDRNPKLPSDRHFLFLSNSCLNMLHFEFRTFLSGSCKNSRNIGLLKSKPAQS